MENKYKVLYRMVFSADTVGVLYYDSIESAMYHSVKTTNLDMMKSYLLAKDVVNFIEKWKI